MKNMELTYTQELEFLGIEQFVDYNAVVIGTNSKGCIIQLEESGITLLLHAGYSVGTRLMVSLNISNTARKVKPIVEWVVSYGDVGFAA